MAEPFDQLETFKLEKQVPRRTAVAVIDTSSSKNGLQENDAFQTVASAHTDTQTAFTTAECSEGSGTIEPPPPRTLHF